MSHTPSTHPPTPETDNWDATALDAPRQRAGEVIEGQSERQDTTQPDTTAEGEATAERQATDHGPSDSA